MGCLVDTFIITPKPEWRDAVCLGTKEAVKQLSEAIPFRYRALLNLLMLTSTCLNDLLDTRNRRKTLLIMEVAAFYDFHDVKFSSRYREECLQQVLRKTFYNTLMIIENDYNPDKFNQFIVVMSNEIITEAEWETKSSSEEWFVKPVLRSLSDSMDVIPIEEIRRSRGATGKVIPLRR